MKPTNKTESKCLHVRVTFIVPGWGCCKCNTYNGYQRMACKNCAHTPCYETDSPEGKEAIELQAIGTNVGLLGEWLKKRRDQSYQKLKRSSL
jgi:hypothetical protein